MNSLNERIKNMSIKNKLGYLTKAYTIGLVIAGIAAIIGAFLLNSQASNLGNNWMNAVELAEEMNYLTSDYRMRQFGHIVAETEDLFVEYEKLLSQIDARIKEVEEEYAATVSEGEDKKLYDEAIALWKEYVEETKEVPQLSRSGNTEAANALMLGEAKKSFEEFQVVYDQLVKYNQEGSEQAVIQSNIIFLIVLILVVVVIVISILIGFRISGIVTGNIVEPTMQLVEAAAGLRRGDLKAASVLTYEAEDEIADLVKNTRESMEVIGGYIDEISAILVEIAKGDLTKNRNEITDFLGDFASVKASLVRILKDFNSTLTDIGNTSSKVASGSGEIAHAAAALAEGTTDEASALEELTATVETVSNMAADSAKNATEAYATISGAVVQAESGREQMDVLKDEMTKITAISQEIANIITAIEDIASQTNLLSLNASIEAARAGEAGRGFAVVADQIGKLASDSAASAVSTRQLIEKTLQEIERGNESTVKTYEAFEQIISDMKVFASLAKGSKETADGQAEALEQISEGIEQISGVVQNTAASAEESAAIGETLLDEAHQMDKLVARFKLFAR